ncbi:MAG TPA: hypothetical protein VFY87_09900 [Geminicoccaceae bacterium]|nr:hypothetical protein [Geminicoccaceae bacterium]
MTASPSPRTAARIEVSRLNGAQSRGPVTDAGKARSALNGTRHGLCSAEFFLLPDEDADAYAGFAAGMLATLNPTDDAERHAAERAVQAMWREIRADRMEAEILAELFGAKHIEDQDAAAASRERAMRALATLLRYRGRIEREIDRALQALDALRQRPAGTNEPGRQRPPAPARPAVAAQPVPPRPSVGTSEPEPARALNRHERRRLKALERQARPRAA